MLVWGWSRQHSSRGSQRDPCLALCSDLTRSKVLEKFTPSIGASISPSVKKRHDILKNLIKRYKKLLKQHIKLEQAELSPLEEFNTEQRFCQCPSA